MAILFVVEIISFMSHSTETVVVLDQSHDQMVCLRPSLPFSHTLLACHGKFYVLKFA